MLLEIPSVPQVIIANLVKNHILLGGHSLNPLEASLSSRIFLLMVSPSMIKATSDSNPGHSLTVFFHDLSERTFSAQNGYDLHCAGLAW